MKKTKILMVCLGNICRSPLAEGILADKLPGDAFFVDSAGTSDYHVGRPPDSRSIEVAAMHGLDISGQKCRSLKISDLEDFDIVYAMDNGNYRDIIALATDDHQRDKVHLIMDKTEELSEVPDPYYGRLEDFHRVYEILERACDRIAKLL